MLQRNAPAPAGLVGNRARVRNCRAHRFGLHGHRAVAGQPLVPVLVAGLEGLLDEQPAKAGAVDEQVTFDGLARIQHQRFDEAALAVLLDLADLALDASHAELLGELAQEFGVHAGVEMIGVVHLGLRAGEELAGLGRLVLETELAELGLDAILQAMQPEMMKADGPGRFARSCRTGGCSARRSCPSSRTRCRA